MQYTHLINLAITLAGILTLAHMTAQADAERLYIGDCITALANHDHFPGTPSQAWDTYAPACATRDYYND